MPLRIYNTLTRRKEEFVPLYPGEVRIYSCGVTVYDRCHVGHARSAMVFDVICRYLAFRGYRVTFVRNFTDVEDKIIRRAQQEGVPAAEISERYIREFQADMEALGVLPVPPGIIYHDPRATEHVPAMVELIERLVSKGYAYVVDGDVYFEIARFPRYGWLSGKNLDELLAGARVEVDERKRDPRDFALWKAAKPGEPSWPSPWGAGRPGWHIECSVMSTHYLGESLDIHGGGTDLIFPHHECEIAQTEADTGRPFARYWVHNGLVNLGAEKMSKSLGNILTINEFVKRHEPDAFRLYVLGTHYRSPVEFFEERVRESARALGRLWGPVKQASKYAESRTFGRPEGEPPAEFASLRERFIAAMDDDFNTPEALGVLFEFGHALHRTGARSIQNFVRGARELAALAQVLGLLEPKSRIEELPAELSERIASLIGERDEARRRRDWRRADEIRSVLEQLGLVVKDTPSGTEWEWRGG
ncbi:MAG: cysteine--tRNA ligase [Candidatus Rokubacteria bacterium]|nr:cysteine--tRNA ligase [Candidatus Rokubacteria bacterium]